MKLLGKHNVLNAAAAVTVCLNLGVNQNIIKNFNQLVFDLFGAIKDIKILSREKETSKNFFHKTEVFENNLFSNGTKNLSEIIAKSDGFSIAGGGETLSAINKYINKDDVSYCSTGGGAFLEFMEGKELPSIQALKSKFK